jgi:hypothetical protein
MAFSGAIRAANTQTRKLPDSDRQGLLGALTAPHQEPIREPVMNTYDPSDYILYVHMDRTFPASESPLARVPAAHRLPGGYANESPRTRLRRAISAGQLNRPLARVQVASS